MHTDTCNFSEHIKSAPVKGSTLQCWNKKPDRCGHVPHNGNGPISDQVFLHCLNVYKYGRAESCSWAYWQEARVYSRDDEVLKCSVCLAFS
jgi:hypothetical protein